MPVNDRLPLPNAIQPIYLQKINAISLILNSFSSFPPHKHTHTHTLSLSLSVSPFLMIYIIGGLPKKLCGKVLRRKSTHQHAISRATSAHDGGADGGHELTID